MVLSASFHPTASDVATHLVAETKSKVYVEGVFVAKTKIGYVHFNIMERVCLQG